MDLGELLPLPDMTWASTTVGVEPDGLLIQSVLRGMREGQMIPADE